MGDVFVENASHGTMQSMGLDYDTLHRAESLDSSLVSTPDGVPSGPLKP